MGCLCFIALAGCSRSQGVTVFCAASLTGVMEGLQPTDTFRVHGGGSQTLLTQFLGGAKADLLILADDKMLDSLPSERNFRTCVIAGNRLVLVAASDRPIDAGALTDPQTRLALADPQTAPLGLYSQQALADISFPARKVYQKDATAVLSALRLGHADLAMVYASDLHRWTGLVELEDFDASGHEPIRYVAVLPEPAHPEALALYRKLNSQVGRKALVEAGFTTPSF